MMDYYGGHIKDYPKEQRQSKGKPWRILAG